MKTFEHNDNTYNVRNGLLFRKDGNIWAYTPYTSDGNLRTKAFAHGWAGEIKKENLIDGGFHNHVLKNN